jgi:hypothetical protein
LKEGKVGVSDVSIIFDPRPFLGQQLATIGLDLAETNRLKACPLGRQMEPADAGK